jgi:hypothetical protein
MGLLVRMDSMCRAAMLGFNTRDVDVLLEQNLRERCVLHVQRMLKKLSSLGQLILSPYLHWVDDD